MKNLPMKSTEKLVEPSPHDLDSKVRFCDNVVKFALKAGNKINVLV